MIRKLASYARARLNRWLSEEPLRISEQDKREMEDSLPHGRGYVV